MKAINKQDLINYLKKSPENLNFNIFGTMLEDFRNTYETDEQIVNKIKGIITNIIEDGGSISPEDDTITELVDLITELLPEKMIIKPVGTLPITENGEYDVMNKAGVNVQVSQTTVESVTFTENRTYTAQEGKAYSPVTVNVIDALGDYIRNNITTFEIPEGVTTIPANTFKNYTNLETIIIPDSVTTIGQNAFYGCTNLTTVDGGCFVNSVGNNAFYGCPSSMSNGTVGQLKYSRYNDKITISGSGNLGNNAFQSNTSITDVIIHNGVTSIGNGAFSGCRGLTSVTIPDSVTSIGYRAFENCTSLTSITIPDSVTSIRDSAFVDCTGLTSVTIPDNVTCIDSSTFEGCTGLTSITIPDSVTSIGGLAFWNCTGLTDVYYTGTQEEWNSITIGVDNTPLTNATVHYNYTPSN